MQIRLVALASLAPLFTVSLAHAQAPGDQLEADSPDADASDAPVLGPAAPAPAPAVVIAPAGPIVVAGPSMVLPAGPVVVRAARRASVMDNRWSVGLSLGSMNLAPKGTDNHTDFAVGELALRFRVTPHLELEASAGGGREQLDNGDEGDLEVNTAAIALRYRFNPEGKWNWFVMGGLGGASVTFHDATDQQRDDATHAMATLGVGVERRFHNFALQAELRAIGIADGRNHDNDKMLEAAPTGSSSAPPVTRADDRLSGASLTIGASYYF